MAFTLQTMIFIYSFGSKLECRFRQSLPYWLAAFLAVSKASFCVSGYFALQLLKQAEKPGHFLLIN